MGVYIRVAGKVDHFGGVHPPSTPYHGPAVEALSSSARAPSLGECALYRTKRREKWLLGVYCGAGAASTELQLHCVKNRCCWSNILELLKARGGGVRG